MLRDFLTQSSFGTIYLHLLYPEVEIINHPLPPARTLAHLRCPMFLSRKETVIELPPMDHGESYVAQDKSLYNE